MVLQQDIIVQLQVQGVPGKQWLCRSAASAGPRPVIGRSSAPLLLAGGGSWAGHWAPEAQQRGQSASSQYLTASTGP